MECETFDSNRFNTDIHLGSGWDGIRWISVNFSRWLLSISYRGGEQE